jgi:hypothetical protein
MNNLAGTKDDRTARLELELASIPVFRVPGELGACKICVVGVLEGWLFTRAWRYWIAQGSPGLPLEAARNLHNLCGTVVRVAGHCGCPPPDVWCNSDDRIDMYYVDTQEGLNTLAKAIQNSGNRSLWR